MTNQFKLQQQFVELCKGSLSINQSIILTDKAIAFAGEFAEWSYKSGWELSDNGDCWFYNGDDPLQYGNTITTKDLLTLYLNTK